MDSSSDFEVKALGTDLNQETSRNEPGGFEEWALREAGINGRMKPVR